MIPSIDLLLPTEILTIIDAIITAVLAVITYYYAKETGLFRNTGQNPPKFSLESGIYAFENNSNNISIRSSSSLLFTKINSHK
jgi:hypothetical protein